MGNGMWWFFVGFAVASACFSGLAAILVLIRKRREARTTAIHGYLDLIPDLTPEQKEKVREIRRTFLPKMERIRRDMRRDRAELARLLFAEPMDRNAVDALAHAVLRRQAELEEEVVEHIIEEQELLTPTQKRKFYEIIMEQFSTGGLGVHDARRSSR